MEQKELNMTSTPTGVNKKKYRVCSICGKSVSSNNYARHWRNHTGTGSKCSQCSLYFEDSSALEHHNEEKHSLLQICPHCGNHYKQISALNEHIRIKHEKTAKVFNCKICLKSFNRLAVLQDHMNVHYKNKPYKCKICSKCYASRMSCSSHERICATVPLSCSVCDTVCTSQSALSAHFNAQHRGRWFSCNGCGNEYKWRSGLARHRSKCTGAVTTSYTSSPYDPAAATASFSDVVATETKSSDAVAAVDSSSGDVLSTVAGSESEDAPNEPHV